MGESQNLLEKELEVLEHQVDDLRTSLDNKPDFTRGVGDPRITRWELDRALLKQLESRVESLKKALNSVDEGTYGVCERCGKKIHPDRMAVLRDAALCIDCAREKT